LADLPTLERDSDRKGKNVMCKHFMHSHRMHMLEFQTTENAGFYRCNAACKRRSRMDFRVRLSRRTPRMPCDAQHITSLASMHLQNQTCVTTMASIWLASFRSLRADMALSILPRRIRRRGEQRFEGEEKQP